MMGLGRLFRVSVFGESHGAVVGAVVEGCPAGMPLDVSDLAADIRRRQGETWYSMPRLERDIPQFSAGLRNGRTTGAPLKIVFANENASPKEYEAAGRRPRPGHADWTASEKYGGFADMRGGGMFSGRMTLPLVAAGSVAKKVIAPVALKAVLLEAGGVENVRKAVMAAASESDSVGGLVECRARGVPAGLGEPFFDSAESMLAHGLFSIPGVKGVEFGAGFAAARMRGSEMNDELVDRKGRTRTNNSGGISGGITSGNELVFRVAVRPTPTIGKPQQTVDMRTGRRARAPAGGRHDVCFAVRMPVVVESVAAVVLADLMMLEQKIPRVWRR